MIQLSVMINYFEEIGDTGDVLGMVLDGNEELTEAMLDDNEELNSTDE